jgi:hypothetical protein
MRSPYFDEYALKVYYRIGNRAYAKTLCPVCRNQLYVINKTAHGYGEYSQNVNQCEICHGAKMMR